MIPAYSYGGSVPMLRRGAPTAPIAPPNSFLQQFPPSQTMPGFQQLNPGTPPKPNVDVPQINPGPTGNLPKPTTNVPQINPGGMVGGSPGAAPSVSPGRSALINSIMSRRQPTQPAMGRYQPQRPMGGAAPQPKFPIRTRPRGV